MIKIATNSKLQGEICQLPVVAALVFTFQNFGIISSNLIYLDQNINACGLLECSTIFSILFVGGYLIFNAPLLYFILFKKKGLFQTIHKD